MKTKKLIIVPTILLGLIALVALTPSKTITKNVELLNVQTNNALTKNEEETFDNEELTEGVVLTEKIAMYPEYVFEDKNETAYLLEKGDVKKEPYEDSENIKTLDKYTEIKLTGTNELTFWEIELDGNTYYINKAKITTDKNTIENMKEEERREEARKQKEAEQRKRQEQTRNPSWNGSVLTPSKGVNYGPSGKETYYNLPMQGVVNIMRGMGNNDPYWVRGDGCKMLGNYIMVAANLNVHPRGSLVETSLGTGIVCDTGGFAAGNPTQLDIAVNW